MSRIVGSSILDRVLVCAVVGLMPAGLALVAAVPTPAQPVLSGELESQAPRGQDPPVVDPFGQLPGDGADGLNMPSPARRAAKKKKSADKSSAKSGSSTAKSKTKNAAEPAKPAEDATAAAGGLIKFSQEIAPILVANCTGCHSGDRPGVKRGKLELTSFQSLQKGSAAHKVVIPGKPEESSLVLRIKGEETPRMPVGANRVMADSAIAKIEQWVKEGARLDAGIDAKAPMESYAASPEQVRRNELAKLPAAERDKKVETLGLERWKQANPKLKPEVVPGDHFMIFSNLPRDRATTTMKTLETQYNHLKRLIASPTMNSAEKVGLYVFANRNDFVEFARTVEGRELEADTMASAKLAIPQPYIAVVDPSGGRKEESTGPRRKSRGKRGRDDSGASLVTDRNLNGLLTEALGTAAVTSAGTPPRWLSLGVGTYLASKLEPRSRYYQHLRQTALAAFEQGWQTKVNEALGGSDQISVDSLHGIGFALVEAMLATDSPNKFSTFLNGLSQGGEKLDEMLHKVYSGTREEFIDSTGDWVAKAYGRLE